MKTLFKYCISIIVTLILLLSTLFYYNFHNAAIQKSQIILIPANHSLMEISKLLEDKKIINSKISFYFTAYIYTKFFHKSLKAGEYAVTLGESNFDLIVRMMKGKFFQRKFIVPEGFTLQQILDKIENEPSIKKIPITIHEFQEGFLLPATYFYTYGTTNLALLKNMKKNMHTFIQTQWPNRNKMIDNIIKTPEEAIILASIVEMEALYDSERPKIAGVYLNRLKKNIRLQADPCIMYIMNLDGVLKQRRLTYKDLYYPSPYNTYRYSGLPPTPISNPGKSSILAVLHPDIHSYMFFVSDKKGKHLFADEFNQHKENIALIKNTTNN